MANNYVMPQRKYVAHESHFRFTRDRKTLHIFSTPKSRVTLMLTHAERYVAKIRVSDDVGVSISLAVPQLDSHIVCITQHAVATLRIGNTGEIAVARGTETVESLPYVIVNGQFNGPDRWMARTLHNQYRAQQQQLMKKNSAWLMPCLCYVSGL